MTDSAPDTHALQDHADPPALAAHTLPPLGDVQPAMDLTCARLNDQGHCGKPATWHVIWTADIENSVTCDEHMAEAERQWTWYDRHPVTSVCSMPDAAVFWSWDEPPGFCRWRVDDDELVAAANAVEEHANAT